MLTDPSGAGSNTRSVYVFDVSTQLPFDATSRME